MDSLIMVSTVENCEPEQSTLPPFLIDLDSAQEGSLADTAGKLSKDVSVLSMRQKSPRLTIIRVNQCDSIRASVASFIAERYARIPGTLAVYGDKSMEAAHFYVLLAEDDEDVLESVFDAERYIYSRFQEETFDFCVLPGKELRSQIPSHANLIWQR